MEQKLNIMNSLLKFHVLFCIGAFLNVCHVSAQEMDTVKGIYGDQGEVYAIGKTMSMHSEVLDQERPLFIYTPDGYNEETDRKYPVIYLLDGGGNFHHTTSTVNFLSAFGRIPEMIVVGIPNTDDRTHDLTPPTETGQNFPTAGGADDMITFIHTELMPFVDQHYRTEDYQLLIGHSFGGLFVTHAILHHPDIFESYISISPSLWWDEQKIVTEQAEKFLDEGKTFKGHIYMTMANEGGAMMGGAMKLAALFEENKNDNFKYHFESMPDENHGSVPFESTIEGLQFIFKDWSFEARREELMMGGMSAIRNFKNQVEMTYGMPAPIESKTLIGMARQFKEGEDWEKAKDVYKYLTEVNDQDWEAWNQLGFTLEKMGADQKAINAYKHSAKIHSDGNHLAVAKLLQAGEKGCRI